MGREREVYGGEKGRTLKRRARAHHAMRDAKPAAHAELAANGVVQCAPGRAPRSTAAAWDKRETIAWWLVTPPSTVEAFSGKISA